MKIFGKVIRKGQDFYIQHTPSKGEYDSMGSIIGEEEIVVKMLGNKKGYESGYLYVIQDRSSGEMYNSNYILKNKVAGLTRAGISNNLKELKKGSDIYILYYSTNARTNMNKPIKLKLIWASGVLEDLDKESRIELSKKVVRLIPKG